MRARLSHPAPLTGVVITLNEEDRIARCLRSMARLCREIVVLDSGSHDATVAIARAEGARVEHQEWLGFSAQKNTAISRATQPWVLMLDADEWLAPSTPERIGELFGSGRVEHADVWSLPRRTRFMGRTLHFGGWGNEWLPRLFRADCRYVPTRHGERLHMKGRRHARFKARIEHDSARSLAEHRARLQRNARRFAEERLAQGYDALAIDPWIHAIAYVLKNYLLRGGFLDGRRGLQFHAFQTRYVFDKYRMLLERQDDTAPGRR